MRAFIYKFLIFCLMLILGVFIIFKIENKIIRNKTKFDINQDAKSIIVGHSHPQVAYNDSLISNFQNLTSSGEAYFYTYQKLRQILPVNPQIKNVFIEFTNNQIDEQMDAWTFEDKYLSQHYSQFISFTTVEQDFELFGKNRNGVADHFSIALRTNLERIVNNDFELNFGGYLHLEKCNVDSLLVSLENGVPDSLKLNSNISEMNLSYLDKIIQLCEDMDKQIILIRTPQHTSYPGYYNEENYQRIRQEKYENLQYLDLSELTFADNEFSDLDHLNYKGAKRFSKWFNSCLTQEFLESKRKQQLIDKEIVNFND